MTIRKVVWNSKGGNEFCVAIVGHSLMQSVTRDNPTVVSIATSGVEIGIFITMSNKEVIQIIHPDEIYYEPAK